MAEAMTSMDDDRDRIARCKSARVRLASFVPELLVALSQVFAGCRPAALDDRARIADVRNGQDSNGQFPPFMYASRRPRATAAPAVPELGCRRPLLRSLVARGPFVIEKLPPRSRPGPGTALLCS